ALKRDLVAGLDMMIVRELTGGIYFGEPRGVETLPDGSRRAINTEVYSEAEIERVVRAGFELAIKRQRRLTEVDKANVMESGGLWREVAERVHADYPEVELSFMYADNCAMQLVRNPKQFDVIVTSNLFGDILSDCAAMLTGSLGMLPSASLGAPDGRGHRKALYEPVHGSAPDIAGKDVANPLACILSFAMMLRYSFDMAEEAVLVEDAVRRALADGPRGASREGDGDGQSEQAVGASQFPGCGRGRHLGAALCRERRGLDRGSVVDAGLRSGRGRGDQKGHRRLPEGQWQHDRAQH